MALDLRYRILECLCLSMLMKPGEVIPVMRVPYPDAVSSVLQVPEVLCVFGNKCYDPVV